MVSAMSSAGGIMIGAAPSDMPLIEPSIRESRVPPPARTTAAPELPGNDGPLKTTCGSGNSSWEFDARIVGQSAYDEAEVPVIMNWVPESWPTEWASMPLMIDVYP